MTQGRLELITGPMFSGKTSEVIRRVQRAQVADKNVRCFKPVIEQRFGEEVLGSHDGHKIKAEAINESIEIVREVTKDTDVVVVDEVNFLDGRAIGNLQSLANEGYRVIASGTEQTFRGTPFHPVDGLMAVADEVDKLQAVCQVCGDDASMNQRLNRDGKPAHVEEETIKIGKQDIYEARCRHCHEVRTK